MEFNISRWPGRIWKKIQIFLCLGFLLNEGGEMDDKIYERVMSRMHVASCRGKVMRSKAVNYMSSGFCSMEQLGLP